MSGSNAAATAAAVDSSLNSTAIISTVNAMASSSVSNNCRLQAMPNCFDKRQSSSASNSDLQCNGKIVTVRKPSFIITSVKDKSCVDWEEDDSDNTNDHCNNASACVLRGQYLTNANCWDKYKRSQFTKKQHPCPVLPAVQSVGGAMDHQGNIMEIGGKIDKAMELVKTHVLYAVRSEIGHLKEQIQCLDKELSRLKVENQFLRQHVPGLVLTNLQNALEAEHAKRPK